MCLDSNNFCIHNCKCKPELNASSINMPEILNGLTELYLSAGSKFARGQKSCRKIMADFRNHVSILVETWEDEDAFRGPRFRPLPNLRVLRFNLGNTRSNDYPSAGPKAILQELLNSTPKLEELTLCMHEESQDWELSSKTLKILKYSVWLYPHEESDHPRPEPPKVHSFPSKILGRFSKYLEKLELGFPYFAEPQGYAKIVDISFPNLTHLTIHEGYKYDVDDFLDSTHLPKLTHLSIAGMLSTRQLGHPGITSLALVSDTCYLRNETAASEIVDFFPSVTKFKLTLEVKHYTGTEGSRTKLGKTMVAFGAWALANGQVVVQGVTPEVVAAILAGLTEWRGLKNTSILFKTSEKFDNFVLTDRIRDELVACRAIRHIDLSGFSMDEQTRNDLTELIARWNLPVSC
ncbi:uncharacterized protein LOC118437271 [Folsomia candida]|uniref:uncharacterized protein LOC118437271 n=1 Tax=Folsomia candida TaxID=158441 RepID=UPI001604AA0F|nr:uncharacterized protein LOC118437271 [Folsomia candida]XP_035712084.1 uncharacterized protein LOC118437271 [Folsomia candida]XP_035712085.1 uncharacterized protein LOC118437271 [Folsomia candida]